MPRCAFPVTLPVISIEPLVERIEAEVTCIPLLFIVREISPALVLMVLLLILISCDAEPVDLAVKLPPFVVMLASVILIVPSASSTILSLSVLELILAPLLILMLRSASRVRVASIPPAFSIGSLTVISPFPPVPVVVKVMSVPALRDDSIVAGVMVPPLFAITTSVGSSSHSPP